MLSRPSLLWGGLAFLIVSIPFSTSACLLPNIPSNITQLFRSKLLRTTESCLIVGMNDFCRGLMYRSSLTALNFNPKSEKKLQPLLVDDAYGLKDLQCC